MHALRVSHRLGLSAPTGRRMHAFEHPELLVRRALPPQHVRVAPLPPASTQQTQSVAAATTTTTQSQIDNSLSTCYVCEEPGGWRLCNCTDRLLHVECQRKIIQKTPSHALGCPVCLTPYSNARSVINYSLSVEGRRLVLFTLGIISVLCIVR